MKLFGQTSRQTTDELILGVLALACWCWWWLFIYDVKDEQIYGSWGFEDEKCLDVFNFPPRIGKHGVNGCRAVHDWSQSINFEYKDCTIERKKYQNDGNRFI